jgi:phage-related protein
MNIFAAAFALSSVAAAGVVYAADGAKTDSWNMPGAAQPAPRNEGIKPTGQGGPAHARNDERPNRAELENFDRFLDAHPVINRDLRENPGLLDNADYMKGQPELQAFLRDHPGVREEIRENPHSFMKSEHAWRGYENRQAQLESLDRFLDGHPQINADVRKDPALLENDAYLKDHAPLKDFLDSHPGIREQVKENPQAFMRGARQYQAAEERDDRVQARLEAFDQFLDKHRELDQDLRKNPSLLNDDDYVAKHKELEQFLAGHPGVRADVTQHAEAFMRRERAYQRQEEAAGH